MNASQMRIVAALGFVVLVCGFGCATGGICTVAPYDRRLQHRFPDELSWIQQQLATASVSDGVSEDEANRLAAAYWTRFCSRCGMVDSVKDRGEYWEARVYTGFITARDGDLTINKTTGDIFWKGSRWKDSPVVTDWSQLTE
jgi:hypothetical protein